MAQALFYPWIDIQDESWLKASLLYWDSVQTIVPVSIDAPYSTTTGRALNDNGFLTPLRVESGMPEIEDLAGDVLEYLNTAEGVEVLCGQNGGRQYPIHLEKLPRPLGGLAHIHPAKLPYEVRRILFELSELSASGEEWLQVNEGFANFYMTLLASRLAERVGSRLVTSLPAAEELAQKARLDAQLSGLIPWDIHRQHEWREYMAFGKRRRMPHSLAPGLLSTLSIERMGVAPDTPVQRLIDFRDHHQDELQLFRRAIDQIVSVIGEDMSIEALRRRIEDLHTDSVTPAIKDLKRALKGCRIKWMTDGLLKIAFLSAGPTALLSVAGLCAPMALLAGAGVSLIAAYTRYNADKEDLLRQNPFSYLLSLQREMR